MRRDFPPAAYGIRTDKPRCAPRAEQKVEPRRTEKPTARPGRITFRKRAGTCPGCGATPANLRRIGHEVYCPELLKSSAMVDITVGPPRRIRVQRIDGGAIRITSGFAVDRCRTTAFAPSGSVTIPLEHLDAVIHAVRRLQTK